MHCIGGSHALKRRAVCSVWSVYTTAISTLAETYEMYILFGAMVIKDGKYYSATVICTPEGAVDTYEKTHLTDEEYVQGLSVGDEPYILSTPYGKFGLALGQEFSDVAELGKYYYGSSVRMVLVSQSYGYETGNDTKLSQAEYDMYTTTYAYVRMYSRYVAVANLYTENGDTTYLEKVMPALLMPMLADGLQDVMEM